MGIFRSSYFSIFLLFGIAFILGLSRYPFPLWGLDLGVSSASKHSVSYLRFDWILSRQLVSLIQKILHLLGLKSAIVSLSY